MAKPKWKQGNDCNGRPIVCNEPGTGGTETPETWFCLHADKFTQKRLDLPFFTQKNYVEQVLVSSIPLILPIYSH